MGLKESGYYATDYLLSKDNSEAAAALRSQLAADYYGEDEVPAHIPAAVFGSEPDTPASRLAAAKEQAAAAQAALAKAEAEQPAPPAAPTPAFTAAATGSSWSGPSQSFSAP